MVRLRDSRLDFDYVVPESEMHAFVVRCVCAAGCHPSQAASVARMLISADRRGHFSHGVNRLHIYVRDLATSTCKPDGIPRVVRQKGSTALVDGDNALGSVVGEFCTHLAIQLAKEHGVGWVAAANSNHFGSAAFYGQQAADAGFVGMAFTNTSPCLFPTRAAEKALGSNPISFVAPAQHGDSFALDMATSTVAYGKIEIAQRKGQPSVPPGWGADASGVESRKPDVILGGGGLMPLGGVEKTGGYKGTGLCQMVEILCGVMAGSAFGKNIREWQGTAQKADLGQCFIVVDPECFAEGFAERLQHFLDETRDLEPVKDCEPVRIPGDFAREQAARVKDAGGLLYHKATVEHLLDLAKELDVEPFLSEALPG